MEIVLIKNTEINGRKHLRGDRLKVTNQLAMQLISDKWARPYPNVIERIENAMANVIKPNIRRNKNGNDN